MPRWLIREAHAGDAARIARVHVDASRAAYREILPAETFAPMSYEKRAGLWAETLGGGGDEFVYVAEDERGEVVGFASGGPEREGDADYDGELYTVYVLGEQQRKGAGRLLVLAVAERLVAEGFRSMLLWVLAPNKSARRFYERLGGQPLREEPLERGGQVYTKVAYGWPDIEGLMRDLRRLWMDGQAPR